MRTRALLAIAIVLPSVASAQFRTPRIGGARPGQPVPLGRQPEVVARSIAIQRSHYSVETYPLIARIEAPGIAGGPPIASTSFGAGTRLDYRYTRYVSWTMDLTSAYAGGPATMATAELGMRIHPEDAEARIRPFADIRFGFAQSADGYASSQGAGFGPGSNYATDSRYSRGCGGVAGAGAEYALTNSFALTTGVSVLRSRMTSYQSTGVSVPTANDAYQMTTYRLAVGLRYNPVWAYRTTP
ncbi:MAG: hypothetical protein M3Z05_09320 [Gemmatimonadota bacterium]|nr:hypothetical protein [Gemmatimonadota bacterium]